MAEKVCFVTTGATAPFTGLIEAVLRPSTIDALRNAGFTHLLVQYGSADEVFNRNLQIAEAHLDSNPRGEGDLTIGGMDFNPEGLKEQFRLVQRTKGLAISHAGSGSILEALRYQVPLIVVPNTALLDNHQEDLARAMDMKNYLIKGDVSNLVPAIVEAEDFRDKMSQFPPIDSGQHRESKSFAAIMDETIGLD